jgi:DnaJ domain/Nuclease-related domain
VPDSPISATPYEVLGVTRSASNDELKAAYRKLLRQTHPDTGGDAAKFIAVQLAWERVGTPESRAIYDRGHRDAPAESSWAPRSHSQTQNTRPRAKMYGHPGGWRRERYLGLIREWVGRGVDLPDPYDPSLVTSAPRELRRMLADALAEEATARTLSHLGIGFTVWHDVAAPSSDEKIDHVVLGPTGLFALLSEDYGGPLTVKRGELEGDALAGERPMHELAARSKSLARATRVKFTALMIVLPDGALTDPQQELGSVRGAPAFAIRQSHLSVVLRSGIPGTRVAGGSELFEVRTRLQSGIRFA